MENKNAGNFAQTKFPAFFIKHTLNCQINYTLVPIPTFRLKVSLGLVLKLAWYIITLYLFIRDRLQTVEYYSDRILYF
jgi:hypothetical protein